MTDEVEVATAKAPTFRIFRSEDAPPYSETSCMEYVGLTPVILDGIRRASDAGADDANVVKLLFSMPGMSLTYAWFKSGFPLPLHSHNADCLYFILAGSLRLGSDELHAGDGFFVGNGVPYSYKPGPQGLEILEFRTADRFDIRFLGKTTAFWDKTVKVLEEKRADWAEEGPPGDSFGKADSRS